MYLLRRSAFMLDTSAHNAGYAGKTDCTYLSIDRGQWLAAEEPLVVSVKIFRDSSRFGGRPLNGWSKMTRHDLHVLLDKLFPRSLELGDDPLLIT